MTTEFLFPYGDSFLQANIPAENISFILKKQELPAVDNEWEAITDSLNSPIECPPLIECIQENDRIVVIVTDNTRACPDDRLLPPILAKLEQKIPRDNITIMIALGLHPPLNKKGLIAKLGDDVIENYRVVNHDVNDTVYAGTTSRGTPVEINRLVVEADFRLSTGFIEPHFFAGFSGGRKSIAPGVFSVRSAHVNHGYKMIEHPRARAGVLQGNPIHEDMVEQAKIANLNFIVNVLLNKNGEITRIVAGDPYIAHERGCELEKKIAMVKVGHKVDITITTNGGAPLDLDLYQTCKGIDTASQITRDGGIIIIASSCNAGLGPKEFLNLHASADSPKEVLQNIKLKKPAGVQWQNQILARAQLKNDIYLVSNLNDNLVNGMMMSPVSTIEEGIEKAFQVLGRDAEVAIIAEGPSVLPCLDEQEYTGQ
ncbi:MAG: nickel-dependent lactate racemase [Dehalococcoidales bacterium]